MESPATECATTGAMISNSPRHKPEGMNLFEPAFQRCTLQRNLNETTRGMSV